MKITILNANQNQDNTEFDKQIIALDKSLKEKSKDSSVFQLRDMNIKYCIGCWTCWWKTPGKCIFKDDTEILYKSVINSDFVIFASPIITGFVSSLMEKTKDRLIPLLHPYIEIVNDECHHRKRYDNYPDIGLLVQKEDLTDDEDMQIIEDLFKRFALNFRSELKYVKFFDSNMEEIVNETCNI